MTHVKTRTLADQAVRMSSVKRAARFAYAAGAAGILANLLLTDQVDRSVAPLSSPEKAV